MDKKKTVAVSIFLSCVFAAICFSAPFTEPQREKKDITIIARRYAYAPNRIIVNKGDLVRIKLGSVDVVHGFFLEGYDIEAEIHPGKIPFKIRHPSFESEFSYVDEISFTADRSGKFRYRCSVTCGTLHPFMIGELIVRPNYSFYACIGGLIGVFAAFLFFVSADLRSTAAPVLPRRPFRLDLFKTMPRLKRLMSNRVFQFTLILVNLAALVLFIFAGFFGSPIGNHNIIITVVWIFWWFVLVTFMIPFGSRIWCMVCPFPFFGEWFQRRKLLGPSNTNRSKLKGFQKIWPKKLSNMWIQNILFLSLCTFSTILVTRPVTTAAVLMGLTLTATIFHMVFRRRTFCRYICPIGGWMSLYSRAAVVEIRSISNGACKGCGSKALIDNGRAWGCPWLINPGKMDSNSNCGMCMECISSCPNSNMTLRLRPFCSDTAIDRCDEAWMGFIMITLVILYTAIFLGPWGTIKEWANITEMGNVKGFLIYCGIIWTSSLMILPAVWFAAAGLSKSLSGSSAVDVKTIFIKYSYVLVPLGLLGWISFSIPLFMINYTHIIATLSDPMGWGWDIFGNAHTQWRPVLPEYILYIQVPLVLTGLGYALIKSYEISKNLYPDGAQAVRSLIPFGFLCTLISIVLICLYAG